MIKFYDVLLSGNCHKVRLALSMMGVAHEPIPVDFMAGEHKSEAFLELNPLGQVPVLIDGALTLRDSQAILIYLARQYGGQGWLPEDASSMGQIVQWLSSAANEIARGPNAARLCCLFNQRDGLGEAQAQAGAFLSVMEAHMEGQEWLECGQPTIADLACYPYVALAPEGEIDLHAFPAIRAWISRVEALPGYVPMPGLPMAA